MITLLRDVSMLLRYSSNAAPRIYSLKNVDMRSAIPRRLIGQRIEVTIWCEELKTPVEGATEIVRLDPAWLSH